MRPDPKAIALLGLLGKQERVITYLTPRKGLVIALLRSNHGADLFDIAVAYQIDGKWHAYLSLYTGSAHEAFNRLATHINGEHHEQRPPQPPL